MTVPPVDILPKHWEIVCGILQKHVPEHEVWALVRALKALPNTSPT